MREILEGTMLSAGRLPWRLEPLLPLAHRPQSLQLLREWCADAVSLEKSPHFALCPFTDADSTHKPSIRAGGTPQPLGRGRIPAGSRGARWGAGWARPAWCLQNTHRANRAPRLSQLLAQREQAVLLVKVL